MNPPRKALITGASSGIGRAFARRFASSGYDLIITGRRKEKLMILAEQLQEEFGISVKIIIAELSVEKDVRNLLMVIANENDLYVLINNAGFGSGKEFLKNDIDSHLKMLQVHVITAIKLVHAALPQMIGRNEGVIINVSSLAAFTPAQGNSVYSSSKIFLKNFTESLHMEVGQYGIKVQCLCPGFTHTDFHAKSMNGNIPKNDRLIHWMEPETVVDKCLKSLEKGKIICVPGFINRLLAGIVPFIPRFIYYQLMTKISQDSIEKEPNQTGKSRKGLNKIGQSANQSIGQSTNQPIGQSANSLF
jgi:uncharacterized protein